MHLLCFTILASGISMSYAFERIIGGSVVEGDARPAFMAVFNFFPSSTVKCSSSIISPHWIVSAAHCIVSKSHIMDGSCLKNYTVAKFHTECEKQPNGDMKLIFPPQEEATPEVYIDVDNLEDEAKDASKKFLVEFIISHRDGYKGGKYGAYGGYDIILLKVRKAMDPDIKVCLPGPSYKFSDPMIGGYGRYRRVPCEVNDLGPHVYRYCQVEKACHADSKDFKQAKCDVEFKYEDKLHHGCIKDEDTPSSKDPECIEFRKVTGITDKQMNRDGVNEYVIMGPKGSLITKCYRHDPGRYGWCGITKHLVTGKQKSEEDMKVRSGEGWGVCGDTCEDKENSHITGKARVKSVQIIGQDYCDEKLWRYRRGQKPFEVPPKVYCVAYNETYNTKFYKKTSEGTYLDVTDQRSLHQTLLGREHPWYIRATGSCKGDSGGPLYEQKGKVYVLLGSTSRGTGELSHCGGIDNPTHYVRVQEFLPWIKTYVPEEDLCIRNE